MYAYVNGEKQLALPDSRAKCPSCDEELIAKCGLIRVWHWSHQADFDCDNWTEPESEWHLGWKKHMPADRVEVVIARSDVKHRADIVAHNGAILELQASTISASEIQARENFYQNMAWLYRVTWAERLHYGKRGFWWKHGALSQTFIKRPLFWEFEDEDLIQQVKLSRGESYSGADRVIGYATRSYTREQFVQFITTGVVPSPILTDVRRERALERKDLERTTRAYEAGYDPFAEGEREWMNTHEAGAEEEHE
jgi:competence CoiA-like predicted nuclease